MAEERPWDPWKQSMWVCGGTTTASSVSIANQVCQARGYTSGEMTGYCRNGCAGDIAWNGGAPEGAPTWGQESSCQTQDQSVVEYRCFS